MVRVEVMFKGESSVQECSIFKVEVLFVFVIINSRVSAIQRSFLPPVI